MDHAKYSSLHPKSALVFDRRPLKDLGGLRNYISIFAIVLSARRVEIRSNSWRGNRRSLQIRPRDRGMLASGLARLWRACRHREKGKAQRRGQLCEKLGQLGTYGSHWSGVL